jgi:cell division protein FtsB
MKQYIALSLLVGAFAVVLFSLFGDDSYTRLQSLRRSIENQQLKNAELEGRVTKLQSEISSIRFDDKQLETTARNELGMARPNELIFRFDSSLDEETKLVEAERIRAGSGGQNTSSASVLRSAAHPAKAELADTSKSVIRQHAAKSNP